MVCSRFPCTAYPYPIILDDSRYNDKFWGYLHYSPWREGKIPSMVAEKTASKGLNLPETAEIRPLFTLDWQISSNFQGFSALFGLLFSMKRL